jgi:hypothetical protein
MLKGVTEAEEIQKVDTEGELMLNEIKEVEEVSM